MNRLKAHADEQVAAWVEEHSDRLELFSLPGWAPELNPEEYLNNDLIRQVAAEGLPDNMKALRWRLWRFMQRLVHLAECVMRHFHHPCVQYAAGYNT